MFAADSRSVVSRSAGGEMRDWGGSSGRRRGRCSRRRLGSTRPAWWSPKAAWSSRIFIGGIWTRWGGLRQRPWRACGGRCGDTGFRAERDVSRETSVDDGRSSAGVSRETSCLLLRSRIGAVRSRIRGSWPSASRTRARCTGVPPQRSHQGGLALVGEPIAAMRAASTLTSASTEVHSSGCRAGEGSSLPGARMFHVKHPSPVAGGMFHVKHPTGETKGGLPRGGTRRCGPRSRGLCPR